MCPFLWTRYITYRIQRLMKPKGCKYDYDYAVVYVLQVMDNQSHVDHDILQCCWLEIYESRLPTDLLAIVWLELFS